MSMGVLPACLSMYCGHGWCLWRPEKALDLVELKLQLVVGIRDEWELNPRPREEQQVLITAEPCSQAFLLDSSCKKTEDIDVLFPITI